MPEILTIQLGSFSNYVGSHFWNIQDEMYGLQSGQSDFAHSISSLYTEKDTIACSYEPRLVLVDFQDNFPSPDSEEDKAIPTNSSFPLKTLKVDTEQSNQHSFQSNITQLRAMKKYPNRAAAKIKELDFPSTTKTCLDYIDVSWEPSKYTVPIREYKYPFDTYHQAAQLKEDHPDLLDHITNQYRLRIEQTDNIGVLHLLLDWQSGFGSLGLDTLCWCREEISKIPYILYASQPVYPSKRHDADTPLILEDILRILTGLYTLTECHRLDLVAHHTSSVILNDFNSLYPTSHCLSPMSQSYYSSSSIAASALHSLSMPYRSRHSAAAVFEYVHLQQNVQSSSLLDLWIQSRLINQLTCRDSIYLGLDAIDQKPDSHLFPYISMQGTSLTEKPFYATQLKSEGFFYEAQTFRAPMPFPSYPESIQNQTFLYPFSEELNQPKYQSYLGLIERAINSGSKGSFHQTYQFESEMLNNMYEFVINHLPSNRLEQNYLS